MWLLGTFVCSRAASLLFWGCLGLLQVLPVCPVHKTEVNLFLGYKDFWERTSSETVGMGKKKLGDANGKSGIQGKTRR